MESPNAYRLSDEERSAVYRTAREVSPDDPEAQAIAALFRAACILLARVFGKGWFQANIAAQVTSTNFVRRPLANELDRMWYVTRAVELAEALYCLRGVPGISQHVESCRLNTLSGESLESAWFEFFVPYLIQKKGHGITSFISPDAAKKTSDVMVQFHGCLLPVEIKAKLEDNPYSRRSLSNSLKLASAQLPKQGPGVVFLMIHSHWMQNADFQRQAVGILQRALTRYRNCNAVYVLCPLMKKLPGGALAYPWRALCVAALTPFEHVNAIERLIDIQSDVAHTAAHFTFLEGAT